VLLTNLLAFTIASILLTLAPGPDILYVIAQSISSGKRAGIITALGLCTGLIFHTTAASFGVSELFRQSPLAFNLVKYAGAAYLFWLAWQAFREKGGSGGLTDVSAKSNAQLYRQGILMNLLNPKVALFFLAFLPQFVSPGDIAISVQMLILGGIFIIQAIAVFSAVSVLSGHIGSLIKRSESASKYISISKGIIFILIGLRIAFGM